MALLQGFTVAPVKKVGKTCGHMDTGLAKEVLRGRRGTKRGGSTRYADKKRAPRRTPSEAWREAIVPAPLFETQPCLKPMFVPLPILLKPELCARGGKTSKSDVKVVAQPVGNLCICRKTCA